MCLDNYESVNTNEVLGVRQRRPAATAAAPAAAETVSGPAAQSLPSTRAGGQDDVSSQANSLKQGNARNPAALGPDM